MNAMLLRFADSPFGVFGWWVLFDDRGQRLAYWPTLEDDWRDNKRNISAIPTGAYECVRVQSPRFGDTFEIVRVSGRSKILAHWGNTEEDTEGCVILGKRFGMLTVRDEDRAGRTTSKWAVLDSRAAFAEFRAATAGLQRFQLTVDWAIGTWRRFIPEEG